MKVNLEVLICDKAVTTAPHLNKQFQYCDQKPINKEGKTYCPLYNFEVVTFGKGCSCRIDEYRKAYQIKKVTAFWNGEDKDG